MDDVQAPPIGTKGTVYGVDDSGSILANWDNGSALNVVYGVDSCRKLGERHDWEGQRTDSRHPRHRRNEHVWYRSGPAHGLRPWLLWACPLSGGSQKGIRPLHSDRWVIHTFSRWDLCTIYCLNCLLLQGLSVIYVPTKTKGAHHHDWKTDEANWDPTSGGRENQPLLQSFWGRHSGNHPEAGWPRGSLHCELRRRRQCYDQGILRGRQACGQKEASRSASTFFITGWSTTRKPASTASTKGAFPSWRSSAAARWFAIMIAAGTLSPPTKTRQPHSPSW